MSSHKYQIDDDNQHRVTKTATDLEIECILGDDTGGEKQAVDSEVPLSTPVHTLSKLDVQRLIDASLLAWTPSAINYKKLIDDALRVAFVERSKSKEGESDRRAEKALRDRVTQLGTQLESLSAEAKVAKAAVSRIKVLEAEMDTYKTRISTLESTCHAQQEAIHAHVKVLEKAINSSAKEERTKRLGMFNKWVKRHGSDTEKLRSALEEGLERIETKAQREWSEQSQCLDTLKDKLDMALIRRLGYLPVMQSNVATATSGTALEAGGCGGAYSTVLGDVRGRRLGSQEQGRGDAGVRSIFSRHLSPSVSPSPTSSPPISRSTSRSRSPSHTIPRSSSCSPSHHSSRSLSPSHRHRKSKLPIVPRQSSATQTLSPSKTIANLVVNGEGEGGGYMMSYYPSGQYPTKGEAKNGNDKTNTNDHVSNNASYLYPYSTPGLFDQGMDASTLLTSMDSRIDDLAAEIARLQSTTQEQIQGQRRNLGERRSRNGGIISWGKGRVLSEDDGEADTQEEEEDDEDEEEERQSTRNIPLFQPLSEPTPLRTTQIVEADKDKDNGQIKVKSKTALLAPVTSTAVATAIGTATTTMISPKASKANRSSLNLGKDNEKGKIKVKGVGTGTGTGKTKK